MFNIATPMKANLACPASLIILILMIIYCKRVGECLAPVGENTVLSSLAIRVFEVTELSMLTRSLFILLIKLSVFLPERYMVHPLANHKPQVKDALHI